MTKRIIWKQITVKTSEVSGILTTHNFQPGKFVITALPMGKVLIAYVHQEIKNVD